MIRIKLSARIALAVFATAAIATMNGTTALAADLPSRAVAPTFEAPPPIPVFTWTGLYIGVQAGYQFGRDSVTAPAFGYAPSPRGIIGGGHVGYNYAIPSAFGATPVVLGIEGDIDGADYRRGIALPGGGTSGTASDVKGSIRGRLGVGINRMLFYATGGAAFADFDTRYQAAPLFGAGSVASFHRSRVGYTVGAGVEYAFMNNFSVRGEYRYSDYGTFVDALALPGTNVSHRETNNRVEAGFSYRFDSILPTSPVVAKY